MQTILVPLDGSALAEQALPTAVDLAVRRGSRVELASVHRPPLPLGAGQSAPPSDRRRDAEIRAGLREYLDATARRLRSAAAAPEVTTVLLEGAAGRELARHARRTRPEVIVLTTHGSGGATRLWLGSVTEELVRRARVPLLVLRPSDGHAPAGGSPSFRRVVVPLDGAPACEPAIALAASFSGPEAATLTLLCVVPPLHPVLRAVAPDGEYERDLAEQVCIAERYLAAVARRLRERRPEAVVETATRVDLSPAVAIASFVAETAADLVVMATHGRGRAGRLLLGAVADKVLRTSPAPVLLCRAAAAGAAPYDDGVASAAASAVPDGAAAGTAAPTPAAADRRTGDREREAGVRRIAVAIDFGEASRGAAAWVARHFDGAELVLVHAVHLPEPPAYLSAALPARAALLDDARGRAEMRLRELADGLAPAHVSPEVRLGVPVERIADVARERDVDLLVVGKHGKWADATRATLGSTAERLARAAVAPVLLARALPDGPPRRLLAAIDDSPCTAGVLAWTAALAERFGARVSLLHVLDPAIAGADARGPADGSAPAPPATLRGGLHAAASSWLARQAASFGPERTVECEVAIGEPGAEILIATGRAEADLVVVGARRGGGGGIPRFGATAERVLRLGDRSVLVVPGAW